MTHFETQPTLSVIIPVFGADDLSKCLQALQKQSYPRQSFEVIVVDNGSPDDIKSILEPFSNIRLEHEDKIGSYAARNKGVLASRGTILVFTDADCIPAPEWLQEGVNRLEQSTPNSVIGGKVNLFWKGETPNSWEQYDDVVSFNQKEFVERKNFSVTANLFVRKETFSFVGDFNEEIRSGGDWEWGERAFEKGVQMIYCEKTQIHHPARSSFQQLLDKHLRLTGSQWSKRTKSWGRTLLRAAFIEILNYAYFVWLLCRQEKRKQATFISLLSIHSKLSAYRMREHIRLATGAEARR